MATWQTATLNLEIPDLPGDAQGIDAWQRFLTSVRPTRRNKTQHATLTCCCCGGAIAAGEPHNWYGSDIYVCQSCQSAKEAVA